MGWHIITLIFESCYKVLFLFLQTTLRGGTLRVFGTFREILLIACASGHEKDGKSKKGTQATRFSNQTQKFNRKQDRDSQKSKRFDVPNTSYFPIPRCCCHRHCLYSHCGNIVFLLLPLPLSSLLRKWIEDCQPSWQLLLGGYRILPLHDCSFWIASKGPKLLPSWPFDALTFVMVFFGDVNLSRKFSTSEHLLT